MKRMENGWLLALAAVGLGALGAAQARTLVVYGASGSVGSVIVNEALSRGDTVIGVARETDKMKFDSMRFRAVAGDITDLKSFEKITKGADGVIISVVGPGKDNAPEHAVAAQAAEVVVKAYTGRKKAPYVLQIGGASTMYETKDEVIKHFPTAATPGSPMYAVFLGHLVALDTYRASRIRWTVLTPPASIEGWKFGSPPEPKRTGRYRTSTTGFVVDTDQKNVINIADLAVAAVDEIENPKFVGKRFTVGY